MDYTDDDQLVATAARAGLKTLGLHELPIPEAARQMGFRFEPREEIQEAPDDSGTENAG